MVALVASNRIDAADMADGVDVDYRHYQKQITAADEFTIEDVTLKWYDIGFEGKPVARGLQLDARRTLTEMSNRWLPEYGAGAGFAFLHDCQSVIFRCAAIWSQNNELWTQVFVRTPAEPVFEPQQRGTGLQPVFCVWEMGVVWHETLAWNRYLASDRSPDDRQTWLADTLTALTPEAL